MKVVIAADLAPDKIGSLECQLFSAARLLEQKGHSVRFLFSGGMSTPVRDHFGIAEEATVTHLGPLGSAASHGSWLEAFRSQQADVLWLHFFPLFGSLMSQIRRLYPRASICMTDHVSRGFPRRNPLKAALCRSRAALFTRLVDQHIAVSQFVARRLKEVDYVREERVHTVYNGIDLARFTPGPSDSSYIAAVCYMRPEKGVHVLLEALGLLKDRGEEPECRLVGVGPELENYRSFAAAHQLCKVQFLGARDDVPEILRKARLVVVPSTFAEAFGLAAAEALAMSVPVIASDIGGLPEVVEDGVNGLLVPAGDARALADRISALLRDPTRMEAMGRAGRARAERLFDLEKQSARIVDLLTA